MESSKADHSNDGIQKQVSSNDYSYTVGWSTEDQVFVARVAEFPSLAAHGETAEEALQEIRFVVAEAISIRI